MTSTDSLMRERARAAIEYAVAVGLHDPIATRRLHGAYAMYQITYGKRDAWRHWHADTAPARKRYLS